MCLITQLEELNILPFLILLLQLDTFYNTNIDKVTIGNKVKVIKSRIFSHCLLLMGEIELPSSLNSIMDYVFYYSSISRVKSGINSLNYCKKAFSLIDLTIFEYHSELTSISDSLFASSI